MRDLLPIVIMLESLAAGIVYTCYDKPVVALYWYAAALLNFAVILMVKGRT